MEHIECLIVIALLIAIIVIQDITCRRERKDLYNRIMASDLPEYEASTNTRKVKSVPNGIRKNIAEAYKKRNSPEE